MRGRKPDKFVLKPKDEIVLCELLRDGHTPLKVARRAQILLNRNDEQQRVVFLGEKVEQDPATIWRVCERYRQGGLQAALYDAPRAGRPRVFSPRRSRGDSRPGLSIAQECGLGSDALVATEFGAGGR